MADQHGDIGEGVDLHATSVPKEARAFQGQRAGAVTRTIACSIDFAVIVASLLVIYVAGCVVRFLVSPSSFSFPEPNLGIAFIVGAVLLWAYLALTWWGTGRSYGCHVMGLRVVNFKGERMHLTGAALRAALSVVFPIGLYWILVSRENRSVADVVLRTSVIHDWQVHVERPLANRS